MTLLRPVFTQAYATETWTKCISDSDEKNFETLKERIYTEIEHENSNTKRFPVNLLSDK